MLKELKRRKSGGKRGEGRQEEACSDVELFGKRVSLGKMIDR